METNGKKLYTTHQVARFLGVTPITVIRWIEGGKLSCYTTLGGHRRIDHQDLERFTREHHMPWEGGAAEENGSSKDYVILMVDDDPDLKTHFRDAEKFLKDVRILQVSDAFSAGAKLVEAKPNLIWINLSATWLDGFSFCGYVRSDVRYSGIPVLATAHTSISHRLPPEKLRELGISDLIVRPFVTSLLIKQLEAFRNPRYQAKAA